jgi:hypothetical protein
MKREPASHLSMLHAPRISPRIYSHAIFCPIPQTHHMPPVVSRVPVGVQRGPELRVHPRVFKELGLVPMGQQPRSREHCWGLAHRIAATGFLPPLLPLKKKRAGHCLPHAPDHPLFSPALLPSCHF